MGEHKVSTRESKTERLIYINHLLNDLKSLEYLLENNLIENDIIRLGAEQEFCLVNKHWRPASNATEILNAINDTHFTTELAKYNLEINLDPFEAKTSVFTKIKAQLNSLIEKAHRVSEQFESKVVLTGILPSITLNEVDISYMTPEPRYFALNNMMKQHRGGDFKVQLTGVDQLSIAHNSVMFEACNTSFQMHLQIDPNDFESSYNWAQAISGPVLAAAVNSPLLLGKELWSETRIALFQQSIDTRKIARTQVDKQARVSIGKDWVRGSIVEHYKKEISRFPILLTHKIEVDSFKEVLSGKIPKLKALNLHNGTVYRWNRLCYGVGGGKPHIRIENRYIPAGPSVIDEIANMAFWVGLMTGRSTNYENLWKKMDFKEVRGNFVRAASLGSESIMSWMGKEYSAKDLILNVLFDVSKKGLQKLNIDTSDINLYLGIIRDRLTTNTGSQWIIKNYRSLRKTQTLDQASLNITQGIYYNQQSEKPVSEWTDLQSDIPYESHASEVGHIMTTSTITANQYDSARLTLELMQWNNIHHLPVLDSESNLVGLVSWSLLDKYWEDVNNASKLLCVEDIMVKNPVTVSASTPIPKALEKANRLKIGSLLVVEHDRLVGIVTVHDLGIYNK